MSRTLNILLNYPKWILTQARADEQILFVIFGLLTILVLLMLLFPEKPPIIINFTSPEEAMNYLDTLEEGSREYLEAECQIKNEVARQAKIEQFYNINN